MSGSATFTIVMSSSSMKTPVQTATRVHHLGPGSRRLCESSVPHRINRQVPNDYVSLRYAAQRASSRPREEGEGGDRRHACQRQPRAASRRSPSCPVISCGGRTPGSRWPSPRCCRPGVDIHAYAVLLALAGDVTRSQQDLARRRQHQPHHDGPGRHRPGRGRAGRTGPQPRRPPLLRPDPHPRRRRGRRHLAGARRRARGRPHRGRSPPPIAATCTRCCVGWSADELAPDVPPAALGSLGS